MTISEKILARAASRENVSPGDIVEADVDILMIHEITGPLAAQSFEQVGFETVWNNDKVVVVFDHVVPPSDIKTAQLMKRMREFVKRYGISNFYDIGRGGVAHQILVEKGYAAPGKVVVGADSHTCTVGAVGAFGVGIGSTEAAAVLGTGKLWFRVPETFKVNVSGRLLEPVSPKDLILEVIGHIGADGAVYKAVEFCGDTLHGMSIDGRMTVANMSIEMGAKTGIVEPDETTMSYVRQRSGNNPQPVVSDQDAHYSRIFNFDAVTVEPNVAVPFQVDNVKKVSELEGVDIDQAFLGTCTNGRIEDLRVAARILRGKKIHPRVRFVLMPASMDVYKQAIREGLLGVFLEANALVCAPTCGPCLGMSQGVLADGEVCISSSNRNFVGRMGHKESKVFLASPATVAASAISGKITDPRRCWS